MTYYILQCVFWFCLWFPFLLLRSCYVALAGLELCTVVWLLACGGPLPLPPVLRWQLCSATSDYGFYVILVPRYTLWFWICLSGT